MASFDEALAITPNLAEAKKLKSKARVESEAVALLEEGERLVEDGRHKEAKETLEKIPKDTDASERAQPTLRHIHATLAYTLKNEAIRLAKSSKKSDLVEAHVKLREALTLDAEDKKAGEMIRDLEKRLKKKKLPFDPWKP